MSGAGIRFAYAPLRYAIAVAHMKGTGLLVDGYAVLMPPPFDRLRVCVRQSESPREWVADHYDSGYRLGFNNVDGTTRASLVESLYPALLGMKNSGRLRTQFAEHGYGWCIDEAGL